MPPFLSPSRIDKNAPKSAGIHLWQSPRREQFYQSATIRHGGNSLFPLSFVAAVLFFGGCATTPTEFTEPAPLAAADRAALNARVFDSAWDLVNERYFDAKFHGVDWPAMRIKYRPAAAAATDDDALYAVLNQMAGELRDKHVYASSPRRVHEGRTEHKADTGIRQRKVNDRWVVTDIIPGSPAEVAGVKRGWVIVSCNGRSLSNELLPVLPPTHVGEPINFIFMNEHDQSRSLSITSQLIPLDQTRLIASDAPGGIRYLRFDYFNAQAMSWLSREIKSHRDTPGVIIDLRDNSGGDETALRLAVREFFAQGQSLGQTVGRAGKTRNLGTLSFFSPLYTGKVVILTSETTASAAEIFSHAMQFHKRATVVGQQTAGLVVAGFKHSLPGGGYMSVAEQDYLGLDGRRLEGIGVFPDIVVPFAITDLRAGHDTGLGAALSWLRDNIHGN